jgi:glutathione synthase/RimK-type ligase-like ATP-grasp enzyme
MTAPIPDLALLYEHPAWFLPLFAALDRRGVDYIALKPEGHWDPADKKPPARVVLNRIAMSSFLRTDEHPIFYAGALLDHWSRSGARVLNGAGVLAIDASKAWQLSLIASLGLAIPATRVVNRIADVEGAATGIGFPVLVKANIGGSGAGIVRYDSLSDLRAAIADRTLPFSIDNVLLVQDFVPARNGVITRIETLDRDFLYALQVSGDGAFDLCLADTCTAPGTSAVRTTNIDLASEDRLAAQKIARAVNLDVGGVEMMIDDRDGVVRFYDINALSNFVARPLDVLGWDPHDRLVDYLVGVIEKERRR